MAGLYVRSLFGLSCDQINAMKKKDLVNHIKNLKREVTVDATIKKLWDEILQSSTSVTTSWQKMGKLVVVSTVNTLLVTRVTELEKTGYQDGAVQQEKQCWDIWYL